MTRFISRKDRRTGKVKHIPIRNGQRRRSPRKIIDVNEPFVDRRWTERELAERWPNPGKFEGETMFAVLLYEMQVEGMGDDSLGDGERFGYYTLFDGVRPMGVRRKYYAITEETSTGFFSVSEFPSHSEVMERWHWLQTEYNKFEAEAE